MCEIFGVVLNTMTADSKYPLRSCENFFVSFLKSTCNLKHFDEKDDRHSSCISYIPDCERLC